MDFLRRMNNFTVLGVIRQLFDAYVHNTCIAKITEKSHNVFSTSWVASDLLPSRCKCQSSIQLTGSHFTPRKACKMLCYTFNKWVASSINYRQTQWYKDSILKWKKCLDAPGQAPLLAFLPPSPPPLPDPESRIRRLTSLPLSFPIRSMPP